ncbi:uncharacterized protein [Dendrobates tinctorius]|uniref:uncharacterized protein isoform X1 n=1 Tax=Dendrobates tinctorius TaxID=92724 RepID=UPI003CC946F9
MLHFGAHSVPSKISELLEKRAQMDSDIFFLSKCKKENLIPKGLCITNPILHTYNTHYAQNLCHRTSERLRNHLLHVCYSIRSKVQGQFETLRKTLTESTEQKLQQYYNKLRTFLVHNKEKKLHRLRLNSGLYTNRYKTNPKPDNLDNHSIPDTKASNCVINLSDYKPNKVELAVLSRGLSFCPTKALDKTELCSDMEQYFRRLHLREYFNDIEDSENTQTEGKGIVTTRKRSDWTPPPGRNPHLDKYIDSFRHLIKSPIIDTNRRQASNISAQKRKAIQSLKTNKEIIIKPADKGGAIVMMNTSDYMKEANRQLMDTRYYRKLESDPTQDYYKELNKLVSCLPDQSIRAGDDLIPETPRIGTFYMLPKIHKFGNPGRPIISCVGTLTKQVSGWVEGILKLLVKDTSSYIQDTTDLLNKLAAIGPLPEGTILATITLNLTTGSIYRRLAQLWEVKWLHSMQIFSWPSL